MLLDSSLRANRDLLEDGHLVKRAQEQIIEYRKQKIAAILRALKNVKTAYERDKLKKALLEAMGRTNTEFTELPRAEQQLILGATKRPITRLRAEVMHIPIRAETIKGLSPATESASVWIDNPNGIAQVINTPENLPIWTNICTWYAGVLNSLCDARKLTKKDKVAFPVLDEINLLIMNNFPIGRSRDNNMYSSALVRSILFFLDGQFNPVSEVIEYDLTEMSEIDEVFCTHFAELFEENQIEENRQECDVEKKLLADRLYRGETGTAVLKSLRARLRMDRIQWSDIFHLQFLFLCLELLFPVGTKNEAFPIKYAITFIANKQKEPEKRAVPEPKKESRKRPRETNK